MSRKPAHEESSVTSCSVVHSDLPELEQRNIEASELVPVFKHSICILLRIGWPDTFPIIGGPQSCVTKPQVASFLWRPKGACLVGYQR